MKRNKMNINMDFIKNKTWFSLMIVAYLVSGTLIWFGFNKRAEGEPRVKEIEKILEEKVKVEFEIVGIVDNDNLAAKVKGNDEIYTIPISTTDFLTKRDSNKLVKEMRKEEFLKMSNKGRSEFRVLDDERDSYDGIIFFGIALGIIIAYGICSFFASLEENEMTKGVIPVIIVWLGWISLLVGSILGLSL